ncbi:MAG: helix-turn-helix domain-containing protein [Micromonosporaceae bacterium]
MVLMNIDSGDIGRRVSYWRARRGYTRRQLADRVGRSVSWLVKVERGERALVRLPMLERMARALEIDVQVLVEDVAANRSAGCPDTVEIRGIKAALGCYGTLLRSPSAVAEPDLCQVGQQVKYACAAWLNAHFSVLGRMLPGLILKAQLASEAASGQARVTAARDLVMVYRLASSLLLKFEAREIAWLAADRAIAVARAADDLVCLARASRSVARAMTEVGQRPEAIAVLTTMATRMEPHVGDDRDLMSLYGMLLLPVEIAAAHRGDAALALETHREVSAVAARLGTGYNHPGTAFGLANVALHRLAALVRMGEGGAAMAYAETVDPTMLSELPRERRANYWLDLCQGAVLTKRYDSAVDALSRAEQLAPEEVRCRPVAHRLIGTLLSEPGVGTTTRLRQLAKRAGVAA